MTIVTHTFNPSVDITYTVPDFHVGDVHRPTETIKNPGGKGLMFQRCWRNSVQTYMRMPI